ncbi:CALMODULIN-BINDING TRANSCRIPTION ACTIVATOR CAMTA [Salix viminalis]|uniref:CALMODULIN-BINDING TRANSCRIPTION ACTIVATOR CAMTA n=1 Tax=Salix viminalis TaxID=40686 RepID=A0A9Q0YXP2_SALVM|nr:CALMODULIN-BINDING TRANSCRIPTION ACTIVATOR CAMTA [Salix viminalis]
MLPSGYDINGLFEEAQTRWLKPAEVVFILQNHDKYQFTEESPQKPTSGSLFLFNKRVLKFFRKDGHNWRKKKDGRSVGEAHERLKVGNVEALNCYYAHGEQNQNFQRRSYWMLDPAFEHIVLVHYRDITEGKPSPGSAAQLSPILSCSPDNNTSQTRGSTSAGSGVYEPYQSFSSPASVDVSSGLGIKDNGVDRTAEFTSSDNNEVTQFLRRLEEQLSLNADSANEIGPFGGEEGAINDTKFLEYINNISKEDHSKNLLHGSQYIADYQSYGGLAEKQLERNNLAPFRDAVLFRIALVLKREKSFQCHQMLRLDEVEAPSFDTHQVAIFQTNLYKASENNGLKQSYSHYYTDGSKEPLPWNEVIESYKTSSCTEYQPKSSLSTEPAQEQENFYWINFNEPDVRNSSLLLPEEAENFELPAYSSVIETHENNSNYYAMLYDQGHLGMTIEADSNLTVAQQQKFTIYEISPEWGYATEATKVIIVGSFLCDPSESSWMCMFGDTEVPLQIIQGGVIRCDSPPQQPGKVTLCITSGNRESCSEIRDFEYRAKNSSFAHCNLCQTEDTKSPEELLLLVRFVQMLLSDFSLQGGDRVEMGIHLLRKLKADDDTWGYIIEALLVGSGTSSMTVDWLLQQLLNDKLQQWLSSKSQEGHDQPGCSFSKKEQGIIHMVAGLGFEWALSPILSHGVSINFRDINGWTALHWAARFGREKMVASLLASGASAGAVTDPSPRDPIGKTPASIAATSGHMGLAGYLSEMALTSHLSSLRLEESELSKGSAELQAERTLESVSKESFTDNEDQVSLKYTLAAARNAAQAAARIQSAFRAHSFRKRQQREATSLDEYGISGGDIQVLSSVSKLAFHGNSHVSNSAALCIQKKYRGWKGRRDFLALRQKVVKIQAHVRGYQMRKYYEIVCWAVGILDKAVLRWRRKGIGLRGFRNPMESIDESEDEDFLKIFRKQKVDGAIDEAVSRVLSMVKSPNARLQYHRTLEQYRKATAGLDGISGAAASTFQVDGTEMENDLYHF